MGTSGRRALLLDRFRISGMQVPTVALRAPRCPPPISGNPLLRANREGTPTPVSRRQRQQSASIRRTDPLAEYGGILAARAYQAHSSANSPDPKSRTRHILERKAPVLRMLTRAPASGEAVRPSRPQIQGGLNRGLWAGHKVNCPP